jgi:hypothetical protein
VSRVLAVLVAVGMVAGALYIRDRIDDDEVSGGGSGGDGSLTLVCAPELAAACEATDADEVVVEDAGETAERLVTSDGTGFDAWVTPGPWPFIVDAERQARSLQPMFEGGSAEVVASTRLALVGPPDTPAGWRTVGEQVGAGDLRLGWRRPESGLGVLQVAAFAVGWFGGPDFASNDLDLDPGFTPYLEGIVDRAEVAGEPLERRLAFGASFAEAVVEPDADARAVLQVAAPGRRGDLAPLYPDPVVAIEAVLVGGDSIAGALGDALRGAGWDEPAADTTNLPSAGVLAALWERVR